MFATHYFQKYDSYPVSISAEPQNDLNIIVVIPCYNEPHLQKSLNSLLECNKTKCAVEVIVIINSSENSPEFVLQQNTQTFEEAVHWAKKNNTEKFIFHILHTPGLKKKDAGVGLARKIGMDAALLRFDQLNNPNGIILGFDADSLCDKNYLTEIEKHFTKNPKLNAASIYFEHPISGNEFDIKIYQGIVEYELHLRYFNQALRYCEFPHAYHTIGSSFAVKANAYMKQGGMNKRQAGEDFYFLHKIIPLENYSEINSTCVIPSSRSSDRVPFGTGAALEKWLASSDEQILTYSMDSFADISAFITANILLFQKSDAVIIRFYNLLPEAIKRFIKADEFLIKINEFNKNSASILNFKKRFFAWFDAFRIIRFLNTIHVDYYKKMPITQEAKKLLLVLGFTDVPDDALRLLNLFRKIERNC